MGSVDLCSIRRRDGLRESSVTTKYFDVNDAHTDQTYEEEPFDLEPSVYEPDRSLVRSSLMTIMGNDQLAYTLCVGTNATIEANEESSNASRSSSIEFSQSIEK